MFDFDPLLEVIVVRRAWDNLWRQEQGAGLLTSPRADRKQRKKLEVRLRL